MHKSKILYKGKVLKNKQAKLDTIFDPSHDTTNEITIENLS